MHVSTKTILCSKAMEQMFGNPPSYIAFGDIRIQRHWHGGFPRKMRHIICPPTAAGVTYQNQEGMYVATTSMLATISIEKRPYDVLVGLLYQYAHREQCSRL